MLAQVSAIQSVLYKYFGINAKNTEKEDAGIKMARIHMHISLNRIYPVKLCPFKLMLK